MDAAELIAAAQEGIAKSDLQFDPALQRYFDPDLNLYYDPNDRSYFDKRSGIFYARNADGEMIQTGRDERYIPEQPESDPSEDEEEIGSDTENKKEPELDDEQKEQMLEQMRIANPSSFIDFSSLEPPPPPPEEDIDEAKEKEDEPVYHGENIRIMVMSSEVVQLGKLHIVTEIGGIIGSAHGCSIVIDEPNVNKKHVSVQLKTGVLDDGSSENYFEALFHAFGQYNGKLVAAQEKRRIKHMDRLTIGSTILILHAHPPGDTCSACESTSIKAELPETLQWGILSGQEQKEFLEKAEAERIREFYNFDKYCWGPGMCKAAQEQLRKREEKALAREEKMIEEKLKKSGQKLAEGEKERILKRKMNKGFNLQSKDPVSLAWYDDRTGQGAIQEPSNPNWQCKRVVKTHSKRMKMQELSRTALSYDQEEAKLKAKSDNRTWY